MREDFPLTSAIFKSEPLPRVVLAGRPDMSNLLDEDDGDRDADDCRSVNLVSDDLRW